MGRRINRISHVCLVMACWAASYAGADDVLSGTVSGCIFPYSKTEVRMASLNATVHMYRDSMSAECSFKLYNPGETQLITVGFPCDNSSAGAPGGDVRGFSCFVDDKAQRFDKTRQLTFINDSKSPDFSVGWYSWEMEISSRDTVTIRTVFSGALGRLFYAATTTCALSSGRLWEGTIGQGRIVFDHSNAFSSDLIIRDSTQHSGMGIDYFPDSVVYSFRDYRPSENEKLTVKFIPYWNVHDRLAFESNVQKLVYQPSVPKMLQNEVLAWHGFVFRDNELKRYFGQRKWYRENKDFSFSMLSDDEQYSLRVFKELEKKN